MVELAIVAPAFLFLAICSFDIARALRNHIMLTQIAREAVRVSSKFLYLEEGQYALQFNNAGVPTLKNNMPALTDPPKYCNGGTNIPFATQLAQKNFMNAITDFVRYHQMELNYQPGTLCVRSEYTTTTTPDQVSVFISIQYQSMFRLFNGIRIRVQSSGTYL